MPDVSRPNNRVSDRDMEVKRRRNEIASAMNDLGIYPEHFRVVGLRITDIRAGATYGDWFDFGDVLEKLRDATSHSVGWVDPSSGTVYKQEIGSFIACLNHFRSWFKAVESQRRLEEEFNSIPDRLNEFIDELKNRSEWADEEAFSENAPFSPADCQQIKNMLVRLEVEIHEHSTLNEMQNEYLADQIRYLTDASSRVGRKDWLNIAVGVVVGLVVNGIFAPDRAQALVSAIVKEVAQLVHVIGNVRLGA